MRDGNLDTNINNNDDNTFGRGREGEGGGRGEAETRREGGERREESCSDNVVLKNSY